jgi:DNA modification methylase
MRNFLNKIIHGDCLEIIPSIPDKSIDMVLCDLPYNITQNTWDIMIPLDKLWEQYKRIIKNDGIIALTAFQPFTSILVMSNLKMFRYEWVWIKMRPTGFLNSKIQPLRVTESILIFYKNPGKYNPQMRKGFSPYDMTSNKNSISKNYNKYHKIKSVSKGERYPINYLIFNYDNEKLHPTQKPIALIEYLINTYTDENDFVLDNCAGSFTTAIACENLNRNWICIEKEEKYCEIGHKRLELSRQQMKLEFSGII